MGLAKRIIPCLDVDNGRVVKGVNFVEIRDAGDPVEIARRYDEQGADEITFLDITASHDRPRDHGARGRGRWPTEVFIPLTVGGGIRTVDDMRRMLNAGADKVAINTAAVSRPGVRATGLRIASARSASWSRSTPNRSRPDRWEVFTHGGRKATGIDAVEWARKMTELRRRRDLADQHGSRRHPRRLRPRADARHVRRRAIPVIASGGVGNLDHLVEGITRGHADAVLAASIFHFGEYTVAQAKQRMAEAGIEVRQ